jgi:hypothetical protein
LGGGAGVDRGASGGDISKQVMGLVVDCRVGEPMRNLGPFGQDGGVVLRLVLVHSVFISSA